MNLTYESGPFNLSIHLGMSWYGVSKDSLLFFLLESPLSGNQAAPRVVLLLAWPGGLGHHHLLWSCS